MTKPLPEPALDAVANDRSAYFPADRDAQTRTQGQCHGGIDPGSLKQDHVGTCAALTFTRDPPKLSRLSQPVGAPEAAALLRHATSTGSRRRAAYDPWLAGARAPLGQPWSSCGRGIRARVCDGSGSAGRCASWFSVSGFFARSRGLLGSGRGPLRKGGGYRRPTRPVKRTVKSRELPRRGP